MSPSLTSTPVTPPWFTDVSTWLHNEGFRSRNLRFPRCDGASSSAPARLLAVRGSSSLLVLHLLATPRSLVETLPAASTGALTDGFAPRRPASLVHLWEDQWSEHSEIVRSRLLAKLGKSARVMARKTVARRIDSVTLDAFLLDNHLWGTTKARYRYGLFDQGDALVAVASFSPRWNVRRHGGDPRASHELIRYCSRRGETVVGGITKLMAAFRRDASPDEIVTVIDRDWGEGGGWASLGFRPLKQLPPVSFYIGPDGRRCHLGGGPNPHRRRLPPSIAEMVERLTDPEETRSFLSAHGYFAVHDAGAERHLLQLTPVEAPLTKASVGSPTETSEALSEAALTRLRGGYSDAAANDVMSSVEPIDFEAAFAAARLSRSQGASVDEATAVATRVLGGDASFHPLRPLHASGGDRLYTDAWLTEADAKLLQHEVISTSGWRLPNGTVAGLLELSAPLPPWADQLARMLTPALPGAVPDRCTVHACESGQITRVLEHVGYSIRSTTAVLSLGSAATLKSYREAPNDGISFDLAPRGLLLMRTAADVQHWMQASEGRHLLLTFWVSSG